MSDFLLSASILSADFTCLRDQIQQAEEAGVNWIHVDVMDGRFVPNISMGPFIVETCRRITHLPLDVHLMIVHPEQYIADFAHAGANRLSVHIEGNPHIHRTLDAIRELGAQPGIVLNPGTPASAMEAVVPNIDLVLVMSVDPGFSGQKFISQTPGKIAQIKRMLDASGSEALIQVDGGITEETLPACYSAGARVFVAATAIFKSPQGITAAVRTLRQSVA